MKKWLREPVVVPMWQLLLMVSYIISSLVSDVIELIA